MHLAVAGLTPQKEKADLESLGVSLSIPIKPIARPRLEGVVKYVMPRVLRQAEQESHVVQRERVATILGDEGTSTSS